MRSCLDCIPCFMRHIIDVARLAGADTALQERLVRRLSGELAKMDLQVPPPVMGGRVHQLVRQATGNADPYAELKRTQNELAQRLVPDLERQVREAPDPFAAAVQVSLAGNIIDLGALSGLTEAQAVATVRTAFDVALPPDRVAEFAAAADRADDILFLADNAGEIVLDGLLIDQLGPDRVTVAVRGGPIINDATMQDARQIGLCDRIRLIDNGSDLPGTVLSVCSASFRRAFSEADLVIAKGQGNFETLSDVDRDIVFLLKVKCPVVARHAGFDVGDVVIHPVLGHSSGRCTVPPDGLG